MWKNEVELDGPQMAKWRMRFACCITKATKHTLNMYTYCFSLATMVTRTRLNIDLSCFVLSRSIEDEGQNVSNLHIRRVYTNPPCKYIVITKHKTVILIVL